MQIAGITRAGPGRDGTASFETALGDVLISTDVEWIWMDSMGFRMIWKDLGGFGGILRDLEGFCGIWGDLEGFGMLWEDSEGLGRILWDLG